MRIAVVGHLVNSPDEGVRGVTFQLIEGLRKENDVISLSAWRPTEWTRLLAYRPQIIHYILSFASASSVIFTKMLATLSPRSRTVISALQPSREAARDWMRVLSPSAILVQSLRAEEMYKALGWNAIRVPVGVDMDRFTPTTPERKRLLRERFGVRADAFVALHVGSIQAGRNVEAMGELQGGEVQVILVGRASEQVDLELRQSLSDRGCTLWSGFFPNIEEIYGLADCYIFPVTNPKNSIEMPLSVLEAMACNLPVIAFPFGAIPDFFDAGGGLWIVSDETSIGEALRRMRNGGGDFRTRQMVQKCSWPNVVRQVEDVYRGLLPCSG